MSVGIRVHVNFPSIVVVDEQYRSLYSTIESRLDGDNLSLNATDWSDFVHWFISTSFVHWKTIWPDFVITFMSSDGDGSELTLMQWSNVTIRGFLSTSLSDISSRSSPWLDREKSITYRFWKQRSAKEEKHLWTEIPICANIQLNFSRRGDYNSRSV